MFKLQFKQSDIDKLIKEFNEKLENEILESLIELCDEAIENQWVKFSPISYDDRTGQLRSSTGYIIRYNGKLMHDRFELSNYGTDKGPGLTTGKKFALEQIPNGSGWFIQFSAGMEYSSWVQVKYNRSVILDATVHAEKNFLKRLKRIVVK